MDENENNVTNATEPTDAPESYEDDAFALEDEPFAEDAAPDESEADADASGDADAPSTDNADADSGGQTDAKPDKTPDADAPSETPETPEPDYKALYEGLQDKANADKYRAIYNEQLSISGNEAVARLIARNECGGKDYPLEDAPDAGTPSAQERSGTDFKAALAEIQSLYPDATEMPGDVMKAFADGTPLKDAYAAHRAKIDAETIATLRRENEALKKTASNRAAAPVKGVNGAPPEKRDPFYDAFNAEW